MKHKNFYAAALGEKVFVGVVGRLHSTEAEFQRRRASWPEVLNNNELCGEFGANFTMNEAKLPRPRKLPI